MSWDKEIFKINNYRVNTKDIINDVKNTCKYDIEIINPISRAGINIRETGDLDLMIDDMTGIFMSKEKNTIEIDALRLFQKSEENTVQVQKGNSIGKEVVQSDGKKSQKQTEFDYIDEYTVKKTLNNTIGSSKIVFDKYDISTSSNTLNIHTGDLIINGTPINLGKFLRIFSIYAEE